MSNKNWDLKLKQYIQLKQKCSINNMLHIKAKSVKIIMPSYTTQTARTSFRHRRLKSPTEEQLPTPQTCRSQQVSPLRDIFPWSSQTPLQKLLNIEKVNDKERRVMHLFICNKWLKEVIQKRSIHVVAPNDEE